MEQWRWVLLEDLNGTHTFYASAGRDDSLWLPNFDGIYRYNGHTIVSYPYPEEWTPSFPNGSYEATDGTVYVSTEHGLRRLRDGQWSVALPYEVRMDLRMVHFSETPQGVVFARSPQGLVRIQGDEVSLIPDTPAGIISICLFDGDLWFTNVFDHRIYRFDLDEQDRPLRETRRSYALPSDSRTHRTVLLKSSAHGFLAANTDPGMGLARYDESLDRWIAYAHDPGVQNTHDILVEASDGSLIVYTTTAVLVCKDGRWRELPPDTRTPTAFPFIIASRSGVVIGGFREPIHYIDTSSQRWESYQNLIFQCEDQLRRRWFLSFDGQVVMHNPHSGDWVSYSQDDGLINAPNQILSTTNNVVWVSGSHEGVAAVSRLVDGTWVKALHPEMGTVVDSQSVFETPEGDVLFGGGDPRGVLSPDHGGVVIYSLRNGDYEARHLSPPGFPNTMRGIAYVNGDYIFGGRELLRYSNGTLSSALQDMARDTEKLWLRGVLLDACGDLWTTQWGNGVVQIKPQGEWVRHNEESGLPSNHVAALAIARDKSAYHVFATSERGVFGFDGRSWSPELFEIPLQVKVESVSMRYDRDGGLWVNAVPRPWEVRHGAPVNVLEPRRSEFFSIRWKPAVSSPDTRIEPMKNTRLIESSNAVLKWKGVTPWSSTPQHQMVYSQRVNGGEWSAFSLDTQKIFFDLPAGNHRFEVRSRDLDGNIDPTPAVVSFKVLPPVWKRAWFIALSLSLAGLIVVLIAIIIRQRIRHLIALEEFRIQFFTNISHELRTPLAVILGPIDSLLEKTSDPWAVERLRMAHRAAQRVLNLVNQLLELRKLEAGKEVTQTVSTDIVQLLREEVEMLRTLAEEKSQRLTFSSNVAACTATVEADKLRIVADNLISNALKYTPESGQISIRLEVSTGRIQAATLCVRDDGPGISPQRAKHIFEAFYRGAPTPSRRQAGTGIGLSLTKSLVEGMGGTIHLASPPPGASQGSEFMAKIPLLPDPGAEASPGASPSGKEAVHEDPVSTKHNRPTILLAEDNLEISRFLKAELTPSYHVLTAENGREALERCRSTIPDIVLADVLMPGMDGRELCRQIKQDELTAHIPVVMLTALKAEEHELRALELGADDYLVKPVKMKVLKQRLENLLRLRRKYQEQFQRAYLGGTRGRQEVPLDSPNQRFVERLQQVVYTHIDDTGFDLDQFAQEMKVSKMTLHRKMKALTGLAPAAFVRTTRLKEAAELLRTGEFQVSEVIHRVGFEDLSHFGAVFKKHYGMTPSQFIEQSVA